VPFDVGLQAVRELREAIGPDLPLARFALRWIIDQPGVSTVIPGARNIEQMRGNAAAASAPSLSEGQLATVRDVYERLIREHVHHRW
jgi:aryl-alcohol dehydrogenase-like predicted oxidoreductase